MHQIHQSLTILQPPTRSQNKCTRGADKLTGSFTHEQVRKINKSLKTAYGMGINVDSVINVQADVVDFRAASQNSGVVHVACM